MAKSYARLGNFKFRIDPDNISYDYKIDYSVINTIGGQVVQVLGATTGDITIEGSFGQERPTKKGGKARESWEIAEDFHAMIRQLMDAQTLPKQGKGAGVHRPISFTYMDGTHDWDFRVLIKSVADIDDDGSIEHKTGKFNYRYRLTLFLVEDRTLNLKKVATDQFIARIATNGLGWKTYKYGKSQGNFSGSDDLAAAIAFIKQSSGGGNLQDYYIKLLTGEAPSAVAKPKEDPADKKPTDPTSPEGQSKTPTGGSSQGKKPI